VTASQSFAVASVFSFLYSSYLSKNLAITLRNRAFVAAVSVYLVLIPALLWNIGKYNSSLVSILTKSEISDFWMCFATLPAFYHIRNSEYRIWIIRSIFVSALLVVLSGFITIFTPFRLASFITAGFQVKDGSRLQHFAGDFWGHYTYLPIGLMNTHLTFGGLCGLFFPGLLAHLSLTFKGRALWKNILLILFILCYSIVLFYNQSRSIWLGVIFTFGLIFIKLISSFAMDNFRIRLKFIFFAIIILLFIGITSIAIYKKNWLLQRAFQEGFEDNTTENQRYFIYKNTLSLIEDHWLIGVGPGQFEKKHMQISNTMIAKNEQLWYELSITPRQHAHHDLLHFFAIGGILGLIAFLHFWFYLFRLFIKNPLTPQTVLFSGILVIFIAGFFQCYLLDDEVALPFFALIGLFGGSLQKEDARSRAIAGILARKAANTNNSFQVESISVESSFVYLKSQIALTGKNSPFEKFNLYTLVVLLIPISASLLYILYKTRLEPMQVYKRKVTINYPQDRMFLRSSLNGKQALFPTAHMKETDTIRIEGCLSHRFTKPISIRKTPFQIKLALYPQARNPPTGVFLTVKERDSFDQDKLYKVHQIKAIGREYYFKLNTAGITLITIGDEVLFTKLLESPEFPENIYFRDFEFRFSGFDRSKENFDLPQIDFGKVCDFTD
jgi:O-antigen ligase